MSSRLDRFVQNKNGFTCLTSVLRPWVPFCSRKKAFVKNPV
jgi:hypothetical protein